MGRNACDGVGLCPVATRRVVCDDGALILGDSGCHIGETRFYRTVWGAVLGLMRV